MSSNTQVHVSVSGSSAVSVAELLGNRGAERLSGLLDRLPELLSQLPAAQRPDFDWVPAGERAWGTTVEGHQVRLDLAGSVAELTVSGRQWVRAGTKANLSPAVLARAEKRLNNLFGLVVAVGISERLSGYVNQRVGTKVSQKIQVKAIETVKNRVALRTTTALKIKSR